MTSLRERKKQQTRQRISDLATALFLARGFDNVTIGDIAGAADVSKMTVFNHFARKEDIFFDRSPEAVALITAAVRNRRPGTTPLAALRALLLDLLDRRHALAGVGENFHLFWRVVADSPALLARARETVDELESLLTTLYAEADAETETDAEDGRRDDSIARLKAAMTVAAVRTAYVTAVTRQLDGTPPDTVATDHAAQLARAFDALERAFAGL